MALFKKKTTLVHHITYMGIMTAINLVFILLATYTEFAMLFLILLLPFASAIVSYYCEKIYYLIYASASIGLCVIFNPSDTLFYVVPAIISGFIIGLFLELKLHPFWPILTSSIINAALSYAFIPLINLIGKTDIVNAFLTLFNLQSFEYKEELVFVFVFLISLVQCVLTHFIIMSDAQKIGIEINTRIASFNPYILGLEVTALLAIIFAFFYLPLSLVFIIISYCFALFITAYLMLAKKLYIYLLLAVILFISIIVFAVLYRYISKPYGVILFVVFPILIAILSFIKNCLIKTKTNI